MMMEYPQGRILAWDHAHSSLSTIGWESEGSCNDVEPSFSLEQKIFQVTGDNIDISIKTKYMSLSRRNKSLHWFNIIANHERIINTELASSDLTTVLNIVCS